MTSCRDTRERAATPGCAPAAEAAEIGVLALRHLPELRRFALALTRDRDRADDLVQDCLLRALVKARMWQPGSNLRAWLFTLLHRLYLSDLRRRAARPVEVAPATALREPSVAPRQIVDVALREVEQAIAALPSGQRVSLLLTVVDGRSYLETARITGVPVGTVRSRVARARHCLQRRFAILSAAAP